MASIIELLFVLLSSLGFGLIPFAGPSNLFIASNWVLVLGVTDSPTLVAIGFLVAIGASVAKSVHYMVTFFVSQHLSEKRRKRLDVEAQKVKRWAFLLLFAAAATPIPDEPVVIPLGLMKYNPAKFFTAFFLGKLSITVAGAFLAAWTQSTFSEQLSPEAMIALSIILTVVFTVILLKVDISKLVEKISQKIKGKKPHTTPEQKPSTTAS
ncbi:MAG: VTT domain-containing protein [Candidatus Bathyarchaeota archaeon]|nr:VTT domain-containing protein [Candidatus Bathyarchaeota archaeon]